MFDVFFFGFLWICLHRYKSFVEISTKMFNADCDSKLKYYWTTKYFRFSRSKEILFKQGTNLLVFIKATN